MDADSERYINERLYKEAFFEGESTSVSFIDNRITLTVYSENKSKHLSCPGTLADYMSFDLDQPETWHEKIIKIMGGK